MWDYIVWVKYWFLNKINKSMLEALILIIKYGNNYDSHECTNYR